MGLWDSIIGGIGKLFGGGGGQAASGLGYSAPAIGSGASGFSMPSLSSGFGQGGSAFGSAIGRGASSLGSGLGRSMGSAAQQGLSGGGAGGMWNIPGGMGSLMGRAGGGSAPNPSGGNFWGSAFGQGKGEDFNLGSFMKSPGTMLGLGGAGMLGSQLIGNPKQPGMPSQYDEYMKMMMSGGTPGMQGAQNYYQGVLSGENKDMYEAAGHSLDQEYQEQLRNLNSQYKSLRPGTDITTDSAYRRDMQQLQDQFARRKAQVMAQTQQGAAAGMSQLGGQQMGGMMTGINAQLDQLADQMGMDFAQKSALRNSILGLGASTVGAGLDPNAGMNQMFNKYMMQKMMDQG